MPKNKGKEKLNKLFKNGTIKFSGKIDPNDPFVKQLLEQTRIEQEKTRELQRIDPEIGNLFVGGIPDDIHLIPFPTGNDNITIRIKGS